MTILIPIITIDGPTASGKGTLAQAVAQHLGFHYLDSGALYRVLALDAMQTRRSLENETELAARAAHLPVSFQRQQILLEGQDVSEAIRAENIGNAASKIAALPAVRAALLGLQRQFARVPGLVTDGRDMGTVVFPHAPLKIFLTANARARAERRFKQLIQKGFSAKLDTLLQDLEERDARDKARTSAPLVAAEGALLLDNSNLTVQETVDWVLSEYSKVQQK